MKILINIINNWKAKRKARKTEHRIRDDYWTAKHHIDYTGENPDENFEVVEKDYLNPTFSHLVLPRRHPDGRHMYFKGIADGLAYLLAHGLSNIATMRSNPPGYVRESVRRVIKQNHL